MAHAASSMEDSSSLDRVARVSHQAGRESVGGIILSEKILRELGGSGTGRAPPVPRGGLVQPRMGGMENNVVDPRQSPRYDADGGVRLAGGRAAVMQNFDQQSIATVSDDSTLPPPYSSDFGDV